MKGITPVIAVILLLMITISMVGFAFIWFSRVANIATNQTQAQLESDLSRQGKRISIENVDVAGAVVAIRNIGSQAINSNELALFVGGTLQPACAWVGAPIAPGAVSTCDWSATPCATNTKVKVTAPGNFDEVTC